MNGGQEERKILAGEEALLLARQGDLVWNEWAEDNPGSEVDFSGVDFRREPIAFAGFVFPGPVIFQSAIFNAGFRGAKFLGDDANFDKARFTAEAGNFQGAEFSGGGASFVEAKFSDGGADFRGAKFIGGPANFIKARFNGRETNFEGAVFSAGAMFDRATFETGNAYFSKAKFRGGDASFGWAVFAGGDASFDETEFSDGRADFGAAKFIGGAADFYNAKFSGGATIFAQAEFSGGNTCFMSTEFGGEEADFGGAKFSGGRVEFNGAVFSGAARFEGVTFDSPVDLEGARFEHVPDFRRTKLAAHFTLHDVRISFWDNADRKFYFLKMAKNPDDADKLRRLKELAVNAKDHDREQEFFASELRAKRFHGINGPALLWSYLYGGFSDFGRSTLRPFVSLFLTWFGFGFGYWFSAICPDKSLGDGLKLSLATLVPFVAASPPTMTEAWENLFGPDVGLLVNVFAFFEGFLGLTFFFLIGLALRNRFRI
jgi:uncharacterized protein YjbI with pentapeptide repeats